MRHGKATERKIAKYLSSRLDTPFERIPVSEQKKEGFDVMPMPTDTSPPYPIGIEAKRRKLLPKLFKNALAQARRHEHKHYGYLLPVVIVAEHGSNERDYVVCMRLEDFTELLSMQLGEAGD